jgi:LCP family protein required for cell wall assembly
MVPNTYRKRKKQKVHSDQSLSLPSVEEDQSTVVKEGTAVSDSGNTQRTNTKKTYILVGLMLTGIALFLIGIFLVWSAVEKFLVQGGGISTRDVVTFAQLVRTQEVKDINLLVLGKGGGSHESPDLTDTIQLLSFKKQDKQLHILSLPRDIWSPTLQDKINAAYYYGLTQQRPEGGMGFASVIVQEITGLPVSDVIVIDFSTFMQLITMMGGVPVDVSVPFTDNEYPVAGKENDTCGGDPLLRCRYTSVSFVQGVEVMNGERALVYVRSRHAQGDEGTDFSRARRQQEVLRGMIHKLTTPWEWMNPEMPNRLYRLVQENIETTLTTQRLAELGAFLLYAGRNFSVQSVSVEPFLKNPSPTLYGGRYVLIPTTSYEDFRTIIQTSVSGTLR